MNIGIEIRNPVSERAQQAISVAKDDGGNFQITLMEGGKVGAMILTKTIEFLPAGASFTLDLSNLSSLDESLRAAILSRRHHGDQTLVVSEDALKSFVAMGYISPDGNPAREGSFSWKIQTSPSPDSITTRPAEDIIQALSTWLGKQQPVARTPGLDTLIQVTSTGDTVRISFDQAIPGNYGKPLEELLKGLPTDKKVILDLSNFGPDSITASHHIIMAAKGRQRAGSEPMELNNIPPSLRRTFNPTLAGTLGITISS